MYEWTRPFCDTWFSFISIHHYILHTECIFTRTHDSMEKRRRRHCFRCMWLNLLGSLRRSFQNRKLLISHIYGWIIIRIVSSIHSCRCTITSRYLSKTLGNTVCWIVSKKFETNVHIPLLLFFFWIFSWCFSIFTRRFEMKKHEIEIWYSVNLSVNFGIWMCACQSIVAVLKL